MCFIVLHEKSERRASSASSSLAFWTDTGSLFCILDSRVDCGKFGEEMGKIRNSRWDVYPQETLMS